MPRMIKVRPADPKQIVRVPENGMRAMDADGMDVERSEYWIRRLADGSVVEVPAEPAPKKK